MPASPQSMPPLACDWPGSLTTMTDGACAAPRPAAASAASGERRSDWTAAGADRSRVSGLRRSWPASAPAGVMAASTRPRAMAWLERGFAMVSPLLLTNRPMRAVVEWDGAGRRYTNGGTIGRRMQFRLLGPLEVVDGDRPLALGGRKQRALLAMLLLHANDVVPAEQL